MVGKRTLYLDEQPLDRAKELFFNALERIGLFAPPEEEIDVRGSLGRITSRPAPANTNVPHFRSSAMDGIAVRAAETAEARGDRPKRLREGLDFAYVDTGEPLPEGFDAIIMVEHVGEVAPGQVEIYKPAFPGQYVREIGEDFRAGQLVLPADYRVTPEAIAALLNAGNLKIAVKRKPSAIFIPTGSELALPDSQFELNGRMVPESNSAIFKGYLEEWGGTVEIGPIVKDSYGAIRAAVRDGVSRGFDLIGIGAGTSKGRADFAAGIVSELGEVLVHGVAYRPGHPVLLGTIAGSAVIGIPGYPVAAWLAIMQFIQPLWERYLGIPHQEPPTAKGALSRRISSPLGYREFVRVGLERTEGEYLVHPLPGGSSRLSSLIRAAGIVEVPEQLEGYNKGEEVEVKLLRPLSRI